MFLVWPNGAWGQSVLSFGHHFSFLAPGMVGRFPGGQCRAGAPSVGKCRLIRVGGSASRISNNYSSTDPGGGGLAAPTKMKEPAWVSPVVNLRLPCWSPSRQSYLPLSLNQVADQPEPEPVDL